MADGPKKISFGFSKLSKQPLLSKPKKVHNANGVQYIDCLESKSIKVKDPIKEDVRELIIPVRTKQSSADSVSNAVTTSRVEKHVENNESSLLHSKKDPPVLESLDTIAAREIMEDLEKKKNVEKNNVLTLPLIEKEANGVSKEASTLEDYESVPVSDFGMAMLRGMGWNPGKGIGKNEKIAPSSAAPVLRPKGMGLGADKLAASHLNDNNSAGGEELKIIKGAFVKVVAGHHKELYAQVEGFDEGGRVIIKSALRTSSVSVLESVLTAVSESEYKKQARVLNLSQYEEQKRKEREKESWSSNSGHKRRRTEKE